MVKDPKKMFQVKDDLSSVSKLDKLIFNPFNVINVGICLWWKFDFWYCTCTRYLDNFLLAIKLEYLAWWEDCLRYKCTNIYQKVING